MQWLTPKTERRIVLELGEFELPKQGFTTSRGDPRRNRHFHFGDPASRTKLPRPRRPSIKADFGRAVVKVCFVPLTGRWCMTQRTAALSPKFRFSALQPTTASRFFWPRVSGGDHCSHYSKTATGLPRLSKSGSTPSPGVSRQYNRPSDVGGAGEPVD